MKNYISCTTGRCNPICNCCGKETIRFATEATYAPFEMFDKNNQIVGFDVDLANAMCEK